MSNEEYRTLEISLLNDLASLVRNVSKLNLSPLEKETIRLEQIQEKLSRYWEEFSL